MRDSTDLNLHNNLTENPYLSLVSCICLSSHNLPLLEDQTPFPLSCHISMIYQPLLKWYISSEANCFFLFSLLFCEASMSMQNKLLLFFFLFFGLAMAGGILVTLPGIEPVSPAGEGQSFNHWTTMEVP